MGALESVGVSREPSVLLDSRGSGVEEAEAWPAVAVGHVTDGHSGLLQHLVQGGLLDGGRRDALLVCEVLQLPARRWGGGL